MTAELVREWLQALLAPTIAIVAVYVAVQQHRTNRDKLRFDLYEKRLAVYHALHDLFGAILRDADLRVEELQAFSRASAESEFLFGDDITEYLNEVQQNAIVLHAVKVKLDQGLVVHDREAVSERHFQVLEWLVCQSEEAGSRFSKYLRFEIAVPRVPVHRQMWQRFNRWRLARGSDRLAR